MSHFFLMAQMRMAQMRMLSNGNIFECDSNIYASHAFDHMILDAGCPQKCSWKVWSDCFIDSLNIDLAEKVKTYPSKSTFKFECGRILTSL